MSWSVPVWIDEQRFTKTARSFGQSRQLETNIKRSSQCSTKPRSISLLICPTILSNRRDFENHLIKKLNAKRFLKYI